MSLLIDALKQAEAAQRQTPSSTTVDGAELRLEPFDATALITPAGQQTSPTPQAPPARASRTSSTPSTQNAARELFEVKRSAPSRLPLVLAAGALTLLTVGAAYIWWATQPRNNLQLGATASPQPIARPAPEPPSSAEIATVPRAEPEASPPAPQPAPAISNRHARKTNTSNDLQAGSQETPAVRRSSGTPFINNDSPIQQAFALYAAGDLTQARQALLEILRSEPKNIDVLSALGMIAQRGGRPEDAARHYRQALVVDPKDANARSQLALLYGDGDPATAESRLRQLLAEQPDSAPALFALGNVYARQQRWSEAQQAFFQSHTLDARNAETLYNLAVSLDHLSQSRLAQQYYERAAANARPGQVAFEPAAALQRAVALQAATANKPASP